MKAGYGILELSRVAGHTVVTRVQATNPLKLLVPRSRGPSVWAYTTNFGGGLVAGDEISMELRAGESTLCFLGTQASTKVYRSPEGRLSRHSLHAVIAECASLIYVPDPVSCFADACYEQRQRFDLASGAGLVLVDWLTCGRRARGERWAFIRYRSRNDVFIGDDHLLADSLLLNPAEGLYRMENCDCLAIVVLAGEPFRDVSTHLLEEIAAEPIQLDGTILCAASPLRHGTILRIAGKCVESVGHFVRQKLAFVRDLLQENPWERKW